MFDITFSRYASARALAEHRVRPDDSKGTTAETLDLFLVSAILLFLELALIRWLPAHVLFLTFFTNTVLLASFLGLCLGCMAARNPKDLSFLSTVALLVTLAAGTGMESIRLALQDIIDVGENRSAPQMVYFGTEARVSDVATFVIPIEWVVVVFFVLTALSMVGLGQILGQRFAAIRNPVKAYMANIGGSLCGVLAFYACSWRTPPVFWFALIAIGMTCALLKNATRSWWKILLPAVAPMLLLIPRYWPMGVTLEKFPEESWSPYYRINYSPTSRTIVVNLLGHQNMVSRTDPFPAYAIPYVLNRAAGQPPFHDILIIGAGSGNDVSRALQWCSMGSHIDAVEIDPEILQLGRRDHPDRPYDDNRVTTHVGDGRNYLRRTDKKYDLIIFALVDSLVLQSSVSNLRLESYLFTREAMDDVRRCLRPSGVFVTYNYFRQGWIVSRLAKTMRDVFGALPVTITLPHRDHIASAEKAEGFTLLVGGPRAETIRAAIGQHDSCLIPLGEAPNPDRVTTQGTAALASQSNCLQLTPTNIEIPSSLRLANDNWPFLYLRNPAIPTLTWHGVLVMAMISFAMLLIFGWARGDHGQARLHFAMLLLGTGFMLLETKAVVHVALLFGSTWIVNGVVISAVLLMILLANLWVLKRNPARLNPYYLGLAATLAMNLAVPMHSLLGLPTGVQIVAAGAVFLSPIFCAGVIFATLFKDAKRPEQALAYNTAGALLGGFAENISLLAGFNSLVIIAALVYGGSWAIRPRS